MSVCSDLSCTCQRMECEACRGVWAVGTSSSITTEYWLSRGSSIISRSSIPSVVNLIAVSSTLQQSSNRMLYPTYTPSQSSGAIQSAHTSPPSCVPTSSATRLATVVAATLRGCVQTTCSGGGLSCREGVVGCAAGERWLSVSIYFGQMNLAAAGSPTRFV